MLIKNRVRDNRRLRISNKFGLSSLSTSVTEKIIALLLDEFMSIGVNVYSPAGNL
ncbi:MAG: hypothetical protein QXZ48_03225 [Zestosphaera sp.]|nr:hypothetical protein [Thermoproteota archaeon]